MGAREEELRDLESTAGTVKDAWSLAAWMVLALVLEQPSHGYEIHRRYERRFGGFMLTSKSSLYAILNRLRDAGMIESIVLEPTGRSRKQHDLRRSYRATREGARAFRRWVAGRITDDSERLDLLARIASVGFLGVDAVSGVIDRYESDCMQGMKALSISDPDGAHGGLAELIESLVVDKRRREMRARIDWAIHARRTLRVYAERAAAEQAGEQ
jgi:DNA-binding PadR family transcriptional regulator